jgi:hypothetical protein
LGLQLLESNREIWPYSKNNCSRNVATRKPQPKTKTKKKPCICLLAILKFLLAKSLKFSQEKKKKNKRLIFVVI